MTLASSTIGYIGSHWRGEQSLAWSFWVNLVLLRVLLFVVQRQLQPVDGEDHADKVVLVFMLAVLIHGVVFSWQVVGAVRAAEANMLGTGSQATLWGVQLSCVLLCWLTLAYAIESWQMAQAIPVEERFSDRMERERRERYTLSVDAAATQLQLQGSIELGVTRRVEALLGRTPTINIMLLESSGGNVYEARGLARLLREHGLASHVESLCASACTIAFIGGSPRSMRESARLGFHQYRLDDARTAPLSDPGEAQQRDQVLFIDAGVASDFVGRMFEQTANAMWWPTTTELQLAGVVDRVIEATAP